MAHNSTGETVNSKQEILKWSREQLNALLLRNNKAVERALVLLYERQTADEQIGECTVHANKVGFSGIDGEILTSFAKQILRSPYPPGQRLSPKQFAVVRKTNKNGICRLAKYWAQIQQFIDAKQAQMTQHVTQKVAEIVKPAAPAPVMQMGFEEEVW